MSEQIKFDNKYYSEVQKYLNSHKDLHTKASFGVDGKLFLTNSKKPSGFILQKCCKNTYEAVLSVINYHPSFKQIKADLEKIIK